MDKNPYPVNSNHGTHIAGIISAVGNNSIGIVGTNPNSKIMAIRAGDNTMTLSAIIDSINFARQNGAKIINASFVISGVYSNGLYDAINSFRSVGGLLITAAGNDSLNNDALIHKYPCDYNLDNIICVASTDQDDNLSSFSNY
jgi:thermitase